MNSTFYLRKAVNPQWTLTKMPREGKKNSLLSKQILKGNCQSFLLQSIQQFASRSLKMLPRIVESASAFYLASSSLVIHNSVRQIPWETMNE